MKISQTQQINLLCLTYLSSYFTHYMMQQVCTRLVYVCVCVPFVAHLLHMDWTSLREVLIGNVFNNTAVSLKLLSLIFMLLKKCLTNFKV